MRHSKDVHHVFWMSYVLLVYVGYSRGKVVCFELHYRFEGLCSKRYNFRWSWSLLRKCLNTELFWSLFPPIWTEYGNLQSKFPRSVQTRENTDQRKLHIQIFYGVDVLYLNWCNVGNSFTEFEICQRARYVSLLIYPYLWLG